MAIATAAIVVLSIGRDGVCDGGSSLRHGVFSFQTTTPKHLANYLQMHPPNASSIIITITVSSIGH